MVKTSEYSRLCIRKILYSFLTFAFGLFLLILLWDFPGKFAYITVIIVGVVFFFHSLYLLAIGRYCVISEDGLFLVYYDKRKPEKQIRLDALCKANWIYIPKKSDKKVSLMTVLYELKSGLYLEIDNIKIRLSGHVSKNVFEVLTDHGAPVAALFNKTNLHLLQRGPNSVQIRDGENLLDFIIQIDDKLMTLPEDTDDVFYPGYLSKKPRKKLKISKYESAFRLNKIRLYVDPVLPFEDF